MAIQSLMNNTKWEEVRLAINEYPLSVFWRTKDLKTGYISNWDSDWLYHFKLDGYGTIEWLEIKLESETKDDIIKLLQRIHVPGKVEEDFIRIYGYSNNSVSYI